MLIRPHLVVIERAGTRALMPMREQLAQNILRAPALGYAEQAGKAAGKCLLRLLGLNTVYGKLRASLRNNVERRAGRSGRRYTPRGGRFRRCSHGNSGTNQQAKSSLANIEFPEGGHWLDPLGGVELYRSESMQFDRNCS
jgi:hypothetical protein